MNINKDDFKSLFEQVNNWPLKPNKILMHPRTYEQLFCMGLIDLYVDILKMGGKVVSCKEVAPNEYEIRIDPLSLYRVYRLKPRDQ